MKNQSIFSCNLYACNITYYIYNSNGLKNYIYDTNLMSRKKKGSAENQEYIKINY